MNLPIGERERASSLPLFVLTVLFAACAAGQSRVVLVDIDGVRRDTFENAYLEGTLPNFSRLLGKHFSTATWFENANAVLPAITMAGQASIFTGVLPSKHGIPGNQWFERRTNRVIDYFSSTGLPCVYGVLLISVVECSGGFANRHLEAPTIYEAATSAGKTSTVIFSQYWTGATHVVLPSLNEAASLVHGNIVHYQNFDRLMMDRALESVQTDGLPDLLTLYFIGADDVGHLYGISGQAAYLAGTIDLQMGRFLDALEKLDPKWRGHTQFIITSDHGRTDAPPLPEDLEVGSAIQDVLQRDGYTADQFRIVDNGGVVHVYLRSRTPGARWIDPPAPTDIVSVAASLSDDATLKAVTETVVFRPNGPGSGYNIKLMNQIDCLRSGDVLLLLKQGRYFGNTAPSGAQHGSIFASDLEVPLVVALGGAKTGRSPVPISTSDVSKIIAAYLGFAFHP